MSELQPSAMPETERPTVAREPASGETSVLPEAGGENAGQGWFVLAYLVCGALTTWLVMWLGTSFFREPVRGAAALWQEMYGRAAFALGALLPAFLMARLERANVDEYGLPRRQAFGKLFWLGSMWGLGAISALMLVLRGTHAFYFGHVVLHGTRALRFAMFWAVFFVLVGLFEEFLFRGYTFYRLARRIGFWPAAAALSLGFGAIHLLNAGESWVGLAGVVAIGFFFCLTLYRTGNLWFAVGFHAFWDWGQTYLYSVPDSGTVEMGHLMQPSFPGPDWLTGGSVGPEGSVLCFAVIAGVSGVFAWRYRAVGYRVERRARVASPGGISRERSGIPG
jgi:membrane protease YdiL (CAAX protease family)